MTEVKHGPNPKFESQITGEPFGLTIVAHYTNTPDLDAGGVSAHLYASDRAPKRRAELLGMRTIFLHWWLTQWRAHDGELAEGLGQMIAGAEDTARKIVSGLPRIDLMRTTTVPKPVHHEGWVYEEKYAGWPSGAHRAGQRGLAQSRMPGVQSLPDHLEDKG